MSLEIPHNVNEWFCSEVLPNTQMMAASAIKMHPTTENEYWAAVVVKYVLESVQDKFQQKRSAKSKFKKYILHPAETVCLYRFLLKYPISVNEHWKVQQMQFVINQLDNHLKNIVV